MHENYSVSHDTTRPTATNGYSDWCQSTLQRIARCLDTFSYRKIHAEVGYIITIVRNEMAFVNG